MVDQFTKWCEIVPLPSQTAETTAKAAVNELCARFGCPFSVHTDQGRNFESKLFKAICDSWFLVRASFCLASFQYVYLLMILWHKQVGEDIHLSLVVTLPRNIGRHPSKCGCIVQHVQKMKSNMLQAFVITSKKYTRCPGKPWRLHRRQWKGIMIPKWERLNTNQAIWFMCLATLNDGKWRSLHIFTRSWFVIATTCSSLTVYVRW
jgi:hypothetical protein